MYVCAPRCLTETVSPRRTRLPQNNYCSIGKDRMHFPAIVPAHAARLYSRIFRLCTRAYDAARYTSWRAFKTFTFHKNVHFNDVSSAATIQAAAPASIALRHKRGGLFFSFFLRILHFYESTDLDSNLGFVSPQRFRQDNARIFEAR